MSDTPRAIGSMSVDELLVQHTLIEGRRDELTKQASDIAAEIRSRFSLAAQYMTAIEHAQAVQVEPGVITTAETTFRQVDRIQAKILNAVARSSSWPALNRARFLKARLQEASERLKDIET